MYFAGVALKHQKQPFAQQICSANNKPSANENKPRASETSGPAVVEQLRHPAG
jgi:hypothetical protein